MKRSMKSAQWSWLAPVLLFAPLLLGAKGCDPAVVGEECAPDDAQCEPNQPPGDDCGGLLGLTCDRGEYCKYAADAACGAADQTGVCEALPSACDGNLDPVCGCDGKTYANACVAASAGISVAADGECETGGEPGGSCGGLTGAACGRAEYCDYPPTAQCGAGDQTGVCRPRPEACEDIFAPVCGCDDKTYPNACEAAGAGVAVASQGACRDPGGPALCGGLTGAACSEGEFCKYPASAQCGAGDQTGSCTPAPEACDLVYAPVCGCDGKTYGNDCAAAMAGVSVAKQGECDAPVSGTCGGRGGARCAEGEYCNYPPDAICGRADATGVCAVKPQGCTRESNPVCGCDGVTYGNPCVAAAAGVSVDYTGQCNATPPPPSGRVCGGLLGSACPAEQYCYFTPAAQCGAADQTGVCRPMPEVCTDEYAPVCGCDDKTYGNACSAAAAGVSVVSSGACDSR